MKSATDLDEISVRDSLVSRTTAFLVGFFNAMTIDFLSSGVTEASKKLSALASSLRYLP